MEIIRTLGHHRTRFRGQVTVGLSWVTSTRLPGDGSVSHRCACGFESGRRGASERDGVSARYGAVGRPGRRPGGCWIGPQAARQPTCPARCSRSEHAGSSALVGETVAPHWTT